MNKNIEFCKVRTISSWNIKRKNAGILDKN